MTGYDCRESEDNFGDNPRPATSNVCQQMLGNLLARIFGDGGHHQAAIGDEAAVREADTIIVRIMAENERLTAEVARLRMKLDYINAIAKEGAAFGDDAEDWETVELVSAPPSEGD
jgi:hypothetical protein